MDALNLRAMPQGRLDELDVVSYTPVLLRVAFALPLFAHYIFIALLHAHLASVIALSSWREVFWPLFVGDALCLLLIIAALLAIYPYFKIMVAAGRPRVGSHNPSAFELISVCVSSAGHLLGLGLLFGFHWKFSGALDSHFESTSLLGSCACLIAVLVLLSAYGIFIKDWSREVGVVSLAAWSSLIILILRVDHDAASLSWQLALLPWIATVLLAICALCSTCFYKWQDWSLSSRGAAICFLIYFVGVSACLLFLYNGSSSWSTVFVPLHLAHVALLFPVFGWISGRLWFPRSSVELFRTAAEARALYLPEADSKYSVNGYTSLPVTTASEVDESGSFRRLSSKRIASTGSNSESSRDLSSKRPSLNAIKPSSASEL